MWSKREAEYKVAIEKCERGWCRQGRMRQQRERRNMPKR
jgi:hypothetical protein